MSLKVYFDLMSQPSRAVLLFLKSNSIPYTACPIAIRKAEHLTDEYEKINPKKQVPAIDHNGFKLTESVSILRYLSREMSVPDHWYPRDSKAQARVDEFMAWQHMTLRLNGAMYFLNKFMFPKMKKEPPNEKSVARFRDGLENALGMMDSVFLKEKKYMGGDKISIADLLGACEVKQTEMAGYDWRADHPAVSAWMDRVVQETSPHFDEVHSMVHSVRDKFGGDWSKHSKL